MINVAWIITFKFVNVLLNTKCYRNFLRPNHQHNPCPRHISNILVYMLFLAGILHTVYQIFVQSCNAIVQEDKSQAGMAPLDILKLKILANDCTQTHYLLRLQSCYINTCHIRCYCLSSRCSFIVNVAKTFIKPIITVPGFITSFFNANTSFGIVTTERIMNFAY